MTAVRSIQHILAIFFFLEILYCGSASAQISQAQRICEDELTRCVNRFTSLNLAESVNCSTPNALKRCHDNIFEICLGTNFEDAIISRASKLTSYFDYRCSSEGQQDYVKFDECTLKENAASCYHTYAEGEHSDKCLAGQQFVACILRICSHEAGRFINYTLLLELGFNGTVCGSAGNEATTQSSVTPTQTDCFYEFGSCATLLGTTHDVDTACSSQGSLRGCFDTLQHRCRDNAILHHLIPAFVQFYEYICSPRGKEDFVKFNDCSPVQQGNAECDRAKHGLDPCRTSQVYVGCTNRTCGPQAARFVENSEKFKHKANGSSCASDAGAAGSGPSPAISTPTPGIGEEAGPKAATAGKESSKAVNSGKTIVSLSLVLLSLLFK